jgi:hypothetical protein
MSTHDRFTYEEQLEVDLETTMAEYLRIHSERYGDNKLAFIEDLQRIADHVLDWDSENATKYLDDIPF